MTTAIQIKEWKTGLTDWETRIVNKESLIPCKPLFKDVSDVALNIFKSLKLVDVIGQPTLGETCKDWVFDFVSVIFGAYDPATKSRLITEFFLLISKKNSKSTISAGIMLTALILNERHSAQFVIVSPTKQTSESSYRPIADMIKADDELKEMFNISDHTKTITHLGTKATLKVLSFDANALTGLKTTGLLVDELHLLGSKAQAENIMREAQGGLASNKEGFVIYLTTQSSGTPQGIFKQKLEYARDIRDKKIINNKFLPVLYEFPKHYIDKELYLDPSTWYITNPNLGASVSEDYLVNQFNQVKDTPSSLQDFLSKHLNIQQGINLNDSQWDALIQFLPQNQKHITLDELIEQSEVLTIGFDGASVFDLAGLTVTGRIKDTHNYLSWSTAWINKVVLEKLPKITSKLLELSDRKELKIVDEVSEQFQEIATLIKYIDDSGKLFQIGIDQYATGTLLSDLEAIGIDTETKIVGVSQGFKMQQHIIVLENLLARNQITLAEQELINWQASNARIVQKSNSIMITKESAVGKIDNLISLLNSIAIMATNPPSMSAKKPSLYFL